MHHPVVLFCYNRPEHVRQTLAALSDNEGAAETPLIIFSDGPANSKETTLVEAVRTIINSTKGFKSVRIISNKNNKGLSANVIDGVTEVLSTYKACIVLEDDLETAPFFLSYMNEALTLYKDDERIFSVSGYCPPIKAPSDYPFESFLYPRINSWGWATWGNRWEKVDWLVSDFQRFISDKKMRSKLADQGQDLPIMLLKQQQGKIASWAVRFNQSCFNLATTNVYPISSFVRNIGIDGSGTHMKNSSKYYVQLSKQALSPANAVTNSALSQQFKNYIKPSCYRRIINFIKMTLYLKNRHFVK